MFWQKNASSCHSLYNMDKVDVTKPLLIVEGYNDCLACIEAGYTNVVSIPGGADDDNWIRFNYSWLEQFEEITLWFDNDNAGDAGTKKVLPRLGEYRCKIVKPLSEDEDAVEKY
jgi:twinkle protein